MKITWIFSAAVPVLLAQSGHGVIYLDDVGCDGSEFSLANCSHRGIGIHNCQHHSKDAGVICTSSGKIVLAITLIEAIIIKHLKNSSFLLLLDLVIRSWYVDAQRSSITCACNNCLKGYSKLFHLKCLKIQQMTVN